MRIVEKLREAADLFREHPVYNSEGDSVLLTVNAALDDEAAALLEQAEAALEDADKRLCALTPRFPPDVGPDMRDVKSIEEAGAVVMQIRALLAKLHEGGE